MSHPHSPSFNNSLMCMRLFMEKWHTNAATVPSTPCFGRWGIYYSLNTQSMTLPYRKLIMVLWVKCQWAVLPRPWHYHTWELGSCCLWHTSSIPQFLPCAVRDRVSKNDISLLEFRKHSIAKPREGVSFSTFSWLWDENQKGPVVFLGWFREKVRTPSLKPGHLFSVFNTCLSLSVLLLGLAVNPCSFFVHACFRILSQAPSQLECDYSLPHPLTTTLSCNYSSREVSERKKKHFHGLNSPSLQQVCYLSEVW